MALGNGLRLGFEQREDAPLVQRDANASWSEQEPALKNAAAAAHQEQAAAAAAAGAAKAEQHNGWSSCWRRPAEAFWANGVACALGSSLCFALAGAFVKALDNRVPVFEIVVVRALISFLVTGISCQANNVPLFGKTAPQSILIARGVIGGSAMTCSYEALVRLPLADSTVIFYLSPALTAVVCWLILGEAFGWRAAAGCASSLAGVVLVAQPPWLLGSGVEWSQQRLLGTIFGFCGAALAAGAYTCIRVIGKREHALTVAMYFHCFAFVSAGLPLAAGYPEPAVLPSPLQAAMLLLIACGSFGGNLLVNRAFQLELAAKASAVNFTQVIWAYAIGTAFFHDPVTLLGLAGTGLIAAGVIIVNWEKMMRAKTEAPATDEPAAAEGLPQHRYQPLGRPQQRQQAEDGGWWRRLWGGNGAAGRKQQQQQQEVAQAPLSRDYRGRLKARNSDRYFETELGVLHEEETGEDGHAAEHADGGGGTGLIGSSGGGRSRAG